MWLVDLNYIFECDWLTKLSDNKLSNNKLSDNNLASELVENRDIFKPITSEEIVIFMIKKVICHNIPNYYMLWGDTAKGNLSRSELFCDFENINVRVLFILPGRIVHRYIPTVTGHTNY